MRTTLRTRRVPTLKGYMWRLGAAFAVLAVALQGCQILTEPEPRYGVDVSGTIRDAAGMPVGGGVFIAICINREAQRPCEPPSAFYGTWKTGQTNARGEYALRVDDFMRGTVYLRAQVRPGHSQDGVQVDGPSVLLEDIKSGRVPAVRLDVQFP